MKRRANGSTKSGSKGSAKAAASQRSGRSDSQGLSHQNISRSRGGTPPAAGAKAATAAKQSAAGGAANGKAAEAVRSGSKEWQRRQSPPAVEAKQQQPQQQGMAAQSKKQLQPSNGHVGTGAEAGQRERPEQEAASDKQQQEQQEQGQARGRQQAEAARQTDILGGPFLALQDQLRPTLQEQPGRVLVAALLLHGALATAEPMGPGSGHSLTWRVTASFLRSLMPAPRVHRLSAAARGFAAAAVAATAQRRSQAAAVAQQQQCSEAMQMDSLPPVALPQPAYQQPHHGGGEGGLALVGAARRKASKPRSTHEALMGLVSPPPPPPAAAASSGGRRAGDGQHDAAAGHALRPRRQYNNQAERDNVAYGPHGTTSSPRANARAATGAARRASPAAVPLADLLLPAEPLPRWGRQRTRWCSSLSPHATLTSLSLNQEAGLDMNGDGLSALGSLAVRVANHETQKQSAHEAGGALEAENKRLRRQLRDTQESQWRLESRVRNLQQQLSSATAAAAATASGGHGSRPTRHGADPLAMEQERVADQQALVAVEASRLQQEREALDKDRKEFRLIVESLAQSVLPGGIKTAGGKPAAAAVHAAPAQYAMPQQVREQQQQRGSGEAAGCAAELPPPPPQQQVVADRSWPQSPFASPAPAPAPAPARPRYGGVQAALHSTLQILAGGGPRPSFEEVPAGWAQQVPAGLGVPPFNGMPGAEQPPLPRYPPPPQPLLPLPQVYTPGQQQYQQMQMQEYQRQYQQPPTAHMAWSQPPPPPQQQQAYPPAGAAIAAAAQQLTEALARVQQQQPGNTKVTEMVNYLRGLQQAQLAPLAQQLAAAQQAQQQGHGVPNEAALQGLLASGKVPVEGIAGVLAQLLTSGSSQQKQQVTSLLARLAKPAMQQPAQPVQPQPAQQARQAGAAATPRQPPRVKLEGHKSVKQYLNAAAEKLAAELRQRQAQRQQDGMTSAPPAVAAPTGGAVAMPGEQQQQQQGEGGLPPALKAQLMQLPLDVRPHLEASLGKLCRDIQQGKIDLDELVRRLPLPPVARQRIITMLQQLLLPSGRQGPAAQKEAGGDAPAAAAAADVAAAAAANAQAQSLAAAAHGQAIPDRQQAAAAAKSATGPPPLLINRMGSCSMPEVSPSAMAGPAAAALGVAEELLHTASGQERQEATATSPVMQNVTVDDVAPVHKQLPPIRTGTPEIGHWAAVQQQLAAAAMALQAHAAAAMATSKRKTPDPSAPLAMNPRPGAAAVPAVAGAKRKSPEQDAAGTAPEQPAKQQRKEARLPHHAAAGKPAGPPNGTAKPGGAVMMDTVDGEAVAAAGGQSNVT